MGSKGVDSVTLMLCGVLSSELYVDTLVARMSFFGVPNTTRSPGMSSECALRSLLLLCVLVVMQSHPYLPAAIADTKSAAKVCSGDHPEFLRRCEHQPGGGEIFV